jgi:hypothetical protein
VSADTDNGTPTTAKSSPAGSQNDGADENPNSPTTPKTTVVGAGQTLVAVPVSPQDLVVASTQSFDVIGKFTGVGITGTCSYSGMNSTTFHNVKDCSGTPADGAALTGITQQSTAADGKADDKSKTSDGNQNLTAALAVTVLVATTQAYISPADSGAHHLDRERHPDPPAQERRLGDG